MGDLGFDGTGYTTGKNKEKKEVCQALEKHAIRFIYVVSLEEQIAERDALLAERDATIAQLKHEIDQLKKLIYGTKSERFKSIEAPPGQGNLFSDPEEQQIVHETEKITYTRTKKKPHPGRHTLPDHLPVREEVIEPDEDTTGMVKIGELITESLEYTPSSLVRLIRILPKYARKEENPDVEEPMIVIGSLPSRPIPKCIAEPSLLAHLVVSKFIDHLPFYRQIQIFKRDFKWEPPKSTVNDWFVAICTLLEPLYERLKEKLLNSQYLQVDESPIKVQDKNKQGSTHRGFQWVYHAPEQGIVLFHYHKSRSIQAPKELLKDYNGWIQCDGYGVYDKLERINKNIRLSGCWVHARRGFDKAKDSDQKRATKALQLFSKIYQNEEHAKKLEPDKRKEYRRQNVVPITQDLKNWIDAESIKLLPKSPIGKAMTYCINQWPKLERCFEEGKLELDNNLIENKIRPLALGRKNYLFAGSHKAAQRIAMMYSFFATCSVHQINPRDWMNHVLENIADTKLKELDKLLPQNYGV